MKTGLTNPVGKRWTDATKNGLLYEGKKNICGMGKKVKADLGSKKLEHGKTRQAGQKPPKGSKTETVSGDPLSKRSRCQLRLKRPFRKDGKSEKGTGKKENALWEHENREMPQHLRRRRHDILANNM